MAVACSRTGGEARRGEHQQVRRKKAKRAERHCARAVAFRGSLEKANRKLSRRVVAHKDGVPGAKEGTVWRASG